ncbi:sensor histidine kinase [Anaeromicropila populeti]|uniref:Oxygen sensor histidine kinase NreB n=1 Tax=Anaeromicropila populeti TaxID=37658 RepID=A0A1I6LML5_9FIRM|nr:sensor histidine kinase [Anaeromicropila populeti]SFS04685.1 two-component system, NarL family, sensor histidine kinase DegS [Anaeromicropila populeti]
MEKNADLHNKVNQNDKSLCKQIKENANNNLVNMYSVSNNLSLLQAQEKERARVARELHDSVVQNLSSLVHKAEFCMRLMDSDSIRVKLELQIIIATLQSTIKEIRDVIYDLKPYNLVEQNLTECIEKYISSINFSQGETVFIFKVTGKGNYLKDIYILTIFRILQEACNNILKHAHAKNAFIYLNYNKDSIELKVEDDGVGFDLEDMTKRDEVIKNFGLSIMKERINLLNGIFDISSKRNEGTSIYVKIPKKLLKGDME